MNYFERVKSATKDKNQFFVHDSASGDTSISYRNPEGGIVFSVSIIPAGVKASVLDKEFDKTRYRILHQGEKGDKLLAKVKELVENPEDIESLLNAIEKVATEYLENN